MAQLGKQVDEPGVYEFEYMRKADTRPALEKFRTAIYNPEDNSFLGRTCLSWGKIITFYTIFYIGLSALFAICMQGLMLTISMEYPRWQLEQSLIGTNPGLGFRPISEQTEQRSLIWYFAKEESSVKRWTNLLDKFLDEYLHSEKLPGNGVNQNICDFDKPPSPGNVCAVDVDNWGPCSSSQGYNYNHSAPCVFLKLNRIYGWVPEYYNDTNDLPPEMPDDLKKYINGLEPIQRNQIWISCNGEDPADRENIGTIRYIPRRGFAGFYYPFKNTPGYLSPLVAVMFERPAVNVLINVECRPWAKNILYRGGNTYREGSVHFELLID